jgi:hypothetical protein
MNSTRVSLILALALAFPLFAIGSADAGSSRHSSWSSRSHGHVATSHHHSRHRHGSVG